MDTPPIQPTPPPTPIQTPPAPNDLKTKITAKLGPAYNNLSPANKRLVTIMAVLLSIVFLLFVLALLFGPRKKSVVAPTPTPVETARPTASPAEITNPSRYATDSGVLKIEADLKNIEIQLNQLKLKDPDLLPPTLDYNINFNK